MQINRGLIIEETFRQMIRVRGCDLISGRIFSDKWILIIWHFSQNLQELLSSENCHFWKWQLFPVLRRGFLKLVYFSFQLSFTMKLLLPYGCWKTTLKTIFLKEHFIREGAVCSALPGDEYRAAAPSWFREEGGELKQRACWFPSSSETDASLELCHLPTSSQ